MFRENEANFCYYHRRRRRVPSLLMPPPPPPPPRLLQLLLPALAILPLRSLLPLLMLAVAEDSPRRQMPDGVYTADVFGPAGRQVPLIALDSVCLTSSLTVFVSLVL